MSMRLDDYSKDTLRSAMTERACGGDALFEAPIQTCKDEEFHAPAALQPYS